MSDTSLDVSLSLAKPSIFMFFKDLLGERNFKYNLKSKVTVRKWNNATNTNDYHPIYLRSKPVIVTNQRFYLNNVYEEIKHILEIWTSQGSGWIIDKVDNTSIERSSYEPLAASSYIPLPKELNNSMKGLINIQNHDDNNCFKWCHVRLINPKKSHPERRIKEDKEIEASLDYSNITFPMDARHYDIVEKRFNINVDVFIYENKRVRPLRISSESNKHELNTSIITNEEGKAHYFFIKDFDRLMFSTVIKNILQCFTKQDVLDKCKKTCLANNNGTQKVTYEEGTITFTNYQNQIPFPF